MSRPGTTGGAADRVVALLQKGEFDAAIESALQALHEQPDNADLQTLLAEAYYESGQLDRCANLLRTQLQRDPESAQTHCNLGQVLAELGDLQAAKQHAEQATRLDPDDALCAFTLGTICAALNQYQAAEQQLAKAVALAPEFVDAINQYAAVLQQLHRPSDALEWYQRALSISPDRPDTLNNLGACWMVLHKPEQAQALFQQALAIDPNYAGAYINLAALAEDQDDLAGALDYYAKAMSIQPGHGAVHSNLAALHLRLGDTGAAMQAFTKAIALEPANGFAIAGLADAYISVGDLSSATSQLERALQLIPDAVYVHEVKARLHEANAETDQAISAYEHAISLQPELTSPRLGLALLYTRHGDYEQAEEIFTSLSQAADPNVLLNWAAMEEKRNRLSRARELLQQAQACHDVDTAALSVLSSKLFMRNREYDKALDALASVNPDSIDKSELKKDYYFQQGRVLDKLQNYAEAFASFASANQLVKDSLVQGGEKIRTDTYEGYEQIWKSVRSPRWQPRDDTTPIFIVGFPRSGTTLLEQILASHPEVTAGDELTIIYELVGGKAQAISTAHEPYPACLLGIDASTCERLRDYYLRRARVLVPGFERYFTDKMPLNLTQLGLIHLIFPDAPIIHIIRHPLDACLSTYTSNFNRLKFSCDLEQIARQYVRVMELASFYKQNFKLRYMEIHYEQLLEAFEPSVRGVLAHAGLQWNPACLDYYKHERVANTESYAQVTEAIYTSARFRYKYYLGDLKPIMPILEGTIDRLGYRIES